MGERRIVNLTELPLRPIGDGGRFAGRSGRAGPLLGLKGLGCSLVVLPPGKAACPMHRHHVRDELFFILEGEGVTRLDDETLAIRAGDLIAAPAGKEAHQIINTGESELRYLAISAENPTDIIEYPDSGKIAVGAGFATGDKSQVTIDLLGRLTPADYFDGESETSKG
jgi:Uncharacterized conserved protein, contains double-stranded beta-helix domain